jgi:hypothetical protein
MMMNVHVMHLVHVL